MFREAKSFEDFLSMANYTIHTKADEKRAEKAWGYYCNHKDSGRWGRALELLTARPNSKKQEVARQGKTDIYVSIRINGRAIPRKGESKSNQSTVYTEEFDVPYMVYSIDICNHNTNYTRRVCDQKIFHGAFFFGELLPAINALKERGKGGYTIQGASKKLFDAMVAYGCPFDREKVYTDDEIFLAERELMIARPWEN